MVLNATNQTTLNQSLSDLLKSQEAKQTATLTPEQQSLSKQAFESATAPLRQSFEERLNATTENLATRGIAFGGLGQQNLERFLGKEAQTEANIASQIGTQLGQTAMEQAYAANEAAKSRQFQKEMQGAGFEFTASQNELNKQFERNTQAVNLILQGNLTGEQAQNIVQNTFGQGVTLTPQDDVDFKRAATAAGLTEAEFRQMRTAIGQGQLMDVLKNTQNYIESPEKMRQFQLQLAQIMAKAQTDATNAQGLWGTLGQIGSAAVSNQGNNQGNNQGGTTEKGGLGGAVRGGAAGSSFGPWGTAAGAVAGWLGWI